MFADIDWENDLDPNDLVFETTLRSETGINDPNLTISTNDLIEDCGKSFDLSTPADAETGQSDSEEKETLSDPMHLEKNEGYGFWLIQFVKK